MSADLLKDRYELLGRLGSGGFSTVFLAKDTLLDREVAIKILKSSLHEDQELVDRFMLEAKLTSRLTHPNTLTVHDFGRDDHGHCFFVTERLVGCSLHEALEHAPLNPLRALDITSQIALALQEAHEKEIIHRDIKPGNIFLSGTKNNSPGELFSIVKLLDFGIAKSIGLESQTVTGQMMGTPTYMSPEQIVNIKDVDHRTDIYSLGIVLFHMLSGSPPFKGESYFDTMRMHMQAPLPVLQSPFLTSQCELEIRELLLTATAKEKSKRFSSARAFHGAMQAIMSRLQAQDHVNSSRAHLSPSPQRLSPPDLAVHNGDGAPHTLKVEASPERLESAHRIPPSSHPDTGDLLAFLHEESSFELNLGHSRDPFSFNETGPSRSASASHSPLAIDPLVPSKIKDAQPQSSGEATLIVREQEEDSASPEQEVLFSGLRMVESFHTPTAITPLRVIILDPNEIAAQLYQSGLQQGADRRKRDRVASGLDPDAHLTVSICQTEIELREELAWGADLVLIDLKARDGIREEAGVDLIKELEALKPMSCHIIALCKDAALALPAMEAGADAVLSKPLRNQQLFDAASVYLWGVGT